MKNGFAACHIALRLHKSGLDIDEIAEQLQLSVSHTKKIIREERLRRGESSVRFRHRPKFPIAYCGRPDTNPEWGV